MSTHTVPTPPPDPADDARVGRHRDSTRQPDSPSRTPTRQLIGAHDGRRRPRK